MAGRALTVGAILLAASEPVSAANPASPGAVVRSSHDRGLASLVTGAGGSAIPVTRVAGRVSPEPIDFLRQHGHLFGVSDPDHELVALRAEVDLLNTTHTTYEQVHRGVPVFAGILKVHQNAAGEIVVANGRYHPIPGKLKTSPSLDAGAAEAAALGAIENADPAVEELKLVIVDPGWYGDPGIGAHLAYFIVAADLAAPMREAFFVDAHTGAILDRWSLIHTARDREVYDGEGGPSLPGTLARNEGQGPVGSPEDVNRAYDYAGDVYDYYFRAFGRDSIDGNGMTMVLTVNSIAPPCPNAFWSGVLRQMVFCSGTVTDDVTAHEITHGVTQFTADLIYQNQSGQLNEAYSDIFGELIDLFNGDAAFAGPPGGTPWPVHATGPGLDTPNNLRTTQCTYTPDHVDGVRWLVGEDATAFGGEIRDMWNPPCEGDPDRANSPLQTCSSSDNGGVHSGSGVVNHAFAIMVDGKTFNGQTVTGLGPIKAGAVWYRALTTYLTPGADFKDAYEALNLAAADLVGSTPNDPRTGTPSASAFTANDALQVDKALLAVEMNTDGACGASQNVLNPDPPVQCDPRATIFLDTFEGGVNGWTVSNSGPPTPYDWVQAGALPFQRPGTAWFCDDPDLGDCAAIDESGIHSLFSPAIVMPADLFQPTLAFTHYLASEPGYDGGNLSIRVDAGSWQLVLPAVFDYNPYNTSLISAGGGNTNPMAGQPAWTGAGGRWGTSLVDLSGFVSGGETIELRFDFGKDGCTGVTGWYLDDFEVYACVNTCVTNEECDDGLFCTGAETCVNTECQPGGTPCPGGYFCDENSDSCLTPVFSEDFENGNVQGWNLSGPGSGSTGSTGHWVIGNPNGTFNAGDAAQPENPFEGSGCGFTGQNSDLGTGDVDGGVVYLVSPAIDLSDAPAAYLSFVRWFFQRDLSGDAGDFWRAEVSSNDGGSWVMLESLVEPQRANSWTLRSFDLGAVIPLTSTVRLRFGASDGTTVGDIVEAAVDNIVVGVPECLGEAECDDTLFCNGAEVCNNGVCGSGASPCASGEWCDESGQSCVPYGDGDFDSEGDVDLADAAAFQRCFGQFALGGCEPGNMTGDGNIDLADAAAHVSALTGPQ